MSQAALKEQETETALAADAASSLMNLVETPCGSEHCGEDPRYSDNFAEIKQEIEKLSGTDFGRVRELAGAILRREAKDLRVMGYLALAETFENGLSGLMEATAAYHYLLERYWDDCHPRRENARKAALQWLNNPRFQSFLEHAGDVSLTALETVVGNIAAINDTARTQLGDDAPQWTDCRAWLDKQLREQQEQARQARESAQRARQAETAAEAGPSVGEIGSERDLLNATREIITFLRQQGDWPRMAAYARALRWGALTCPPAEDGRTRIPAPRQPALAAIEQALAGQAWQDAWLACEAAFMEPGAQFCMQIQQWAAQAAEGMGRRDVAELIRNETLGLLKRVPELSRLRFENGEPFVGAICEPWIQELLSADAHPEAAATETDEAWVSVREQARGAAKDDGLAAALRVVDGYPTHCGRERVRSQVFKAQLCMDQGRAELALPALEAAAERIEQLGLADWEPDFALQVWRPLHRALAAGSKASGGLPADEAKRRLEALKAKICRADLTAAAGLL